MAGVLARAWPLPADKETVITERMLSWASPLGWRTALCAVAGAVLAASLPPATWWPGAVLGLGAVTAGVGGQRLGRRFLLGAVTGIVFFAVSLRWVIDFHAVGYGALVLLESGFLAAAMTLVPPRRGHLVALPGAVVLFEAVRSRWPFGGLPLSGLALGQVDGPLVPLVRLVGPLGLLLAVAALGALLVAMARGRWSTRVLAAVAAVAIVAAPLTVSGPPPATSDLRAAAVQGGGPRGIPAVRTEAALVMQRQLEASAELGPTIDLVVWPEGAVDVAGRFAAAPERVRLAELAERLGAVVVAGVIEPATSGPRAALRFRNAAVAVGPAGRLLDRYDKVIRVPFGEYVPERALLSRLVDLSLVPRDAVAGTGPAALETPLGDLGVAISFEGLFARSARAAARAGGQLLLIPTNAASYVTGQVPAQQVAAARLRAVETGRDVVQAAPTGYSAVISADGVVRRQSSLGGRDVLTARVALREGLTPYVRLGDAPALVGAIALIALGWAWEVRRRKEADATYNAM